MSLIVKHLKDKKFEVICRSHRIITDQPESDGGADQGMNPVELMNASLASCAAYYAVNFLERRIPDLVGLEVRSSWICSETPHRVGTIGLTIVLPHDLSEPEAKVLLRSVEYCTIGSTLKYAPKIRIKIKKI